MTGNHTRSFSGTDLELMSTFADQFEAAAGAPIQYGGRELHATFTVEVTTGDAFAIRFLSSARTERRGGYHQSRSRMRRPSGSWRSMLTTFWRCEPCSPSCSTR
jgi:hypothetical protein